MDGGALQRAGFAGTHIQTRVFRHLHGKEGRGLCISAMPLRPINLHECLQQCTSIIRVRTPKQYSGRNSKQKFQQVPEAIRSSIEAKAWFRRTSQVLALVTILHRTCNMLVSVFFVVTSFYKKFGSGENLTMKGLHKEED